MKPRYIIAGAMLLLLVTLFATSRTAKADRPQDAPQTVILFADIGAKGEQTIWSSDSSPDAPMIKHGTSLASADAYLRGLGFRRVTTSDNQLYRSYEH